MATASSLLGKGLGLVLVEFEYEYQGRDGDLVSIKPNERYVLLAKTNDHWWQVRSDCSSKPFYIPAKYVRELPVDLPLNFSDTPEPEPALLPVAAPVPVPVPIPVPKTLDGSGTKTDEVTIRLRPEGYRKPENRMSTFGVPLDSHELSHSIWSSGSPAAPSESRSALLAGSEQHWDFERTTAEPSLVPVTWSQNQPVPVETPVVPVICLSSDVNSTSSLSLSDHLDLDMDLNQDQDQDQDQESLIEPEEEEEDLEELESPKDLNHIYESIQDLNLDPALLKGPPSPEPGPDDKPATPPGQNDTSLAPLPVYANLSLKKPTPLHISIDSTIPPPPSVPAPTNPGQSLPSSSSSMEMLSPASPLTSADEAQPPLPEEDYPVSPSHGGNKKDEDDVFTVVPPVPLRRMGNGVSEEGTHLQVRNWRHSVAEESFGATHRRNVSDVTSDMSNRRLSPDSAQFSSRQRLRRNLSNHITASHQQHNHLLEKAGIINKTKIADHGKKMRKNWTQSWTVLHGGILTFHKDPKSAPSGTASKTSQIVPEYTVDLRGATIVWASKEKSSKKNVLELKTRQGCEILMQYDTESIIGDWLKVILDAITQLDREHLTDEEDETGSDREDRDQTTTASRSSTGSADSEQKRIRTKLKRFLQRRPTLQSVKEKGYIRDNVFGCHLDTLCHRENTTVPKFVEKCVRAVERRGLDIDGIYRVSGNLAVIQKLRHKADHEEQLDLDDGQWQEIHVITGALKLFFRELPEPLFPFSCFHKFITAIQIPDYDLRVSYITDLVRALPLPNHNTMELLFKHLRRVTQHRESNRMSVQSLAIVFGPTLLRPQVESPNMTIHMVFQSQIVELILNEFQNVFPAPGS
ncbi:rho GTPase-activating protein 15 [Cynoglossus semilaevis]|uniref:rho GTPase-activating protein 15 n=1 Tax=Cynoglossus semilaevis TaxID=244447 RepID=UPI000D629418|nr:rho GTPase-activating protein 15-like [Cynoglossus semilaevis]